MDLSSAQYKQIETWADLRDKALLEVSLATTEAESLKKKNIELSNSNTEIQHEIGKSEGRLIELKNKEEESVQIVSKELSQLKEEKTQTETILSGLKKEITYFYDKKEELIKDISLLTQLYDKTFEKISPLEKIVEHVTKISSENIKEIELLIVSLQSNIKNIIGLSTLNIEKHNDILHQIPSLFVELRKKTLGRPSLLDNKEK